ncbi:MAG: 30S ribosomal protein S20 [Verrucomicrobiales bacterium]
MPNTKSAEKRVRKTKAQTARNRVVKTRLKSAKKKAEEAIASGDKAAAEKAAKELASIADRAAKSNVIHKKAADRLKGRSAAKAAAAGA